MSFVVWNTLCQVGYVWLQGEGRVAMATADLMLGEWLPDISLVFKVRAVSVKSIA